MSTSGTRTNAVDEGPTEVAAAKGSRRLRIGDVARIVGTTARTIRYYEEIGLLPASDDREQGKHRLYTAADLDRIREIVRLRDLLGLSLEQLSTLLEAETARAEIRREYRESDDPARRRRLLEEALPHIATQLALVRERLSELRELEADLSARQERIGHRLEELQAADQPASG